MPASIAYNYNYGMFGRQKVVSLKKKHVKESKCLGTLTFGQKSWLSASYSASYWLNFFNEKKRKKKNTLNVRRLNEHKIWGKQRQFFFSFFFLSFFVEKIERTLVLTKRTEPARCISVVKRKTFHFLGCLDMMFICFEQHLPFLSCLARLLFT